MQAAQATHSVSADFVTDKVYRINYRHFDEATGAEKMYANIFLFEVGADYPTEHLANADVADLWLIQEDLDELISLRANPGQWVGWIDCMKKSELMSESASSVLNTLLEGPTLKIAFETCTDNYVPELYLHPYPLDVYDDEIAQKIQLKLIELYTKNLKAIKGHKNLMIKPL